MSVDTLPDRLTGEWRFNAIHSSVDFSLQYLVAKFRGRFEEVDASLRDGVLTGSAKVASVNVKDSNLIGHLQSPDFFDAEQHAELSFTSTTLEAEGDNLTLDGELTIKGITRPVHATGTIDGPTEDFMGNTRLGFTLETKIDRTEFGLNWNAELPKGGKALSDEVTLIVELEFTKV